MGRAIKLVLYYFAYQLAFTFLVGLPAGIIKVMNEISENDNLAYAAGKNTASMTGLVMVLAGIAMIWHLIYFKYVQFNKTSWTEVPAKTILLSIPFIIAAMFICNVASEFIELPNLVEDTFIGMSRNVFGIIAIAVMAPLVEELLFRGAIEGHFLQTGKRPGMAILLSALIFGLIHVNPAQVPFAFCLGLVFGWLYYRTGSIIPGMIGHFLNNSLATIAMATSTQEELNEKTVDMIGATPTYILLAAAIIILVGMYFYLNTSTTVSIMFHSFTSAFKAGYESVEKGKDIHISDYKMICTLPTDLLEKTGSVTNVRTGEQASIIPIISMVEAPTKENDTFHALNRIASFISVIAGIFCLLQFFYLIRNINRGDIFSWKNVKFLRKLGWALILLFICTLATIVIGNYEASQVLQLNGCEFSYTFAFSDATLILGFISLLVAEVFAIGLKMKEEQDLTI